MEYLGATMNELSFIDALSDESYRDEGRHFLAKLKTAGIADTTTQFVRSHAPEIAASMVGAGLASGYAYLKSKPIRGELSAYQQETRDEAAHQKLRDEMARKSGKERGFAAEVRSAVAPASARVADAMAKHPGKGALMVAPIGASAGLTLFKALKG